MWTYLFAGVAVLIFCIWSFVLPWWRLRRVSRLASRVTGDGLRSEKFTSKERPRLEPECRFVVRLSDSEVVCERPDGTFERVNWSDLEKVEIVTTSDGPLATDVFWVLHGSQGGCAVPGGATGEMELLERLQTLPGFDNEVLIEAMGCTSNRRFVCWQRGHEQASSAEGADAS